MAKGHQGLAQDSCDYCCWVVEERIEVATAVVDYAASVTLAAAVAAEAVPAAAIHIKVMIIIVFIVQCETACGRDLHKEVVDLEKT